MRKILLKVADGPEGIEIYTSEDEGMVDFASTFPAMYILVSLDGASVKMGPFTLPSIYRGIADATRR